MPAQPVPGLLPMSPEDEHNSIQLDKVIKGLSLRAANEHEWAADFYELYLFRQSLDLTEALAGTGKVIIRQLQYLFRMEDKLDDGRIVKAFPPVTSEKDRKLSDPELQRSTESIELQGQYNVLDATFSVLDGKIREELPEIRSLPGYQFLSGAQAMLPYLLIEYKKEQSLRTTGTTSGYARSYLTLLASCILYQRLKLRNLAGLSTILPCEDMIIHCIVVAGPVATYFKVGLRPPKEDSLGSSRSFVRYNAWCHMTFTLRSFHSRNEFLELLGRLHHWGWTTHHEKQREELIAAHRALPGWKVETRATSRSAHEALLKIRAETAAFVCQEIVESEGAKTYEVKMSMVEDTEDLPEKLD